jgi:DNA polymerase-3 subunit delta'
MSKMDCNGLIGNEAAQSYLNRMLENDTLSQSLLFTGPDGIGKGLFAQRLALALLSRGKNDEATRLRIEHHNHPDLQILRTEGKTGSHSIDSMRELSHQVYQAPFEAPCKVFIIYDADRMAATSANALLKTFEEPLESSVLILLSHHAEGILPTVLSRCRKVPFIPVPKEQLLLFLREKHGIAEDLALQASQRSHGSIGQALLFAKADEDPTRKLLLESLAQAPLAHYEEVKTLAKSLADSIEKQRKADYAHVSAEFEGANYKDMTAVQQTQIQKDIEGIVALKYRENVKRLLNVAVAWFRDLQVIQAKGDPKLLAHPDFQKSLEKVAQRGQFPSIESSLNAAQKTCVAIERSSSLAPMLESFILKLC